MSDTPVSKHNPYHDAKGRFTTSTGTGVGSDISRDNAYRAKVETEGGRAASSRAEIASDLRTPDGGFTFDLNTNSKVTAGFAVSPYPERSTVVRGVKSMDDNQINAAVDSYIARNSDMLVKPRHYLGGWHDPQTGTVYLDVSVVEETSGAAYRLGLEHDQIAYFDLQSFESVDIDRNAKSGQE